ncbi:MAG: histidine phosphatase family protein [Dehalococcoidia bacterium]|nr:histidine phosphatase family protein [Dehalococcoidia bacterium]
MTIYLIRHGQALAGSEDLDPGLAEIGHRQARATADALAGRRVARLVVSPLRRTRETADPISRAFGVAAEVREEVAEVFAPDMPAEHRVAMIGPFMAGRWGEQPDDLRAWRQRVVDTLIQLGLETAATDGDLVVVSHYIAIGVAIGEAMGDDRVVPVPMANCAITTIEAGDGSLALHEACSIAHLPAELVTGSGGAQLR